MNKFILAAMITTASMSIAHAQGWQFLQQQQQEYDNQQIMQQQQQQLELLRQLNRQARDQEFNQMIYGNGCGRRC